MEPTQDGERFVELRRVGSNQALMAAWHMPALSHPDSAALNVAATSGVQIPGACIYGSSESSAGVFVYAQVYPDTTTADAVQPDQIATILAGQLGVANAHSVSGIGDKAFEYTATGSGENGIAIFVFKANVVMMIVVNPTTNSASVEQLARTAVSRLKAG